MIRDDESILICDLAETYGVFEYRQLPLHVVAALFSGLRDNSRLRQKIDGIHGDEKDVMLAFIADGISAIYSALTGTKQGKSLTKQMFERTQVDDSEEGRRESARGAVFESAEDFMKARYGGEV